MFKGIFRMQPVTRPGSYWSPCQGPSPGPGDPRGEAGRSLTSHPTGHAGLTYPAPSRSAASPLTPGLWASDPRQSPKSKVPLRRGEFSSSEDIQSGITSKQAPCKEPECQLCCPHSVPWASYSPSRALLLASLRCNKNTYSQGVRVK